LAGAIETVVSEPVVHLPSQSAETVPARVPEPLPTTPEAIQSSASPATGFAGPLLHLEPGDFVSPKQKDNIEHPSHISRPRRGDKQKVHDSPAPPVNIPGIIFKVQSGPPKKAAKPHPPEAKVNLNSVSPVRFEDGKVMLENGIMGTLLAMNT